MVSLIENSFDAISKIAGQYDGAAQLIDHLTQSILSKAFRGELVPQDANDEPASALLERIRAERAAHPKPKRRGCLECQNRRRDWIAGFQAITLCIARSTRGVVTRNAD